jgi:small subunit ribosomal protein S6
MRKYEICYIVKPDLAEEAVDKVIEQFKGAAENLGAVVEKAARWEKRKLAYELAGYREGTYILMNLEAEAKAPAELNRLMRINDDIIRHRIFKLED